MIHRGEIVEEAVRKSGYSLTRLARELGKSRRWIYLVFDNPNVSIDLIIQIGKIIHHNFAHEIAEIRNLGYNSNLYEHEKNNYFSTNDINSEENFITLKNKYIQLLEEYKILSDKLIHLQSSKDEKKS